jgi:ubiquinone/menaquinone biosynthesis C-methylase UbiE
MPGPASPFAPYQDASGYDGYMGQWSVALAPLFLRFALREEPASLLDVGVGTGSLLAAAARFFPQARLAGIDPSSALLSRARVTPGLAEADIREGFAEALPFPDNSFDACLSLLVLQEFPDVAAALREMKRVTRPGGIVAACQWNFLRMPVVVALLDAIAAVEPRADALPSTNSPRRFQNEAELAAAWTEQGLERVCAGRIEVTRVYRDFDELWEPLLTGPTPSTMVLAALPEEKREAVRTAMQLRLAPRAGLFSLTSEALAVKGTA